MDENILIETSAAQTLYHRYAQTLPVIERHSRISAQDVADNKTYGTITELWSYDNSHDAGERAEDKSDHWRRFEQKAKQIADTPGSTEYISAHLALKSVFGITKPLHTQTAREIYDACNEQLNAGKITAQTLLKHYGVEMFCTVDDPTDDLRHHRELNKSGFGVQMLPTWQPDRAMNIGRRNFRGYIEKLGEAANIDISTFEELMQALQKRHDFFAENGCRMSDHRLEEFYDEEYTDSQIEIIFEKAMRGQDLSASEVRQYKHCFLSRMGEMDNRAGWVQQYHYGVLPIYNKVCRNAETMGQPDTARAMTHFFTELQSAGNLAKTVVSCINPSSFDLLCNVAGFFQNNTQAEEMQFGMGWCIGTQFGCPDVQLDALIRSARLGSSIGISSGAASLLALSRHEYFRRLLCRRLGRDVESGLVPDDMPLLGDIVERVCYKNARSFFAKDNTESKR